MGFVEKYGLNNYFASLLPLSLGIVLRACCLKNPLLFYAKVSGPIFFLLLFFSRMRNSIHFASFIASIWCCNKIAKSSTISLLSAPFFKSFHCIGKELPLLSQSFKILTVSFTFQTLRSTFTTSFFSPGHLTDSIRYLLWY